MSKKDKLTSMIAEKILKVVPHREAFYFFTGIGEYTGEFAVSLDDFYYKITDVDLKSVLFHFYRKDFEKWIKETIGDATLADEIGRLAESFTGKELNKNSPESWSAFISTQKFTNRKLTDLMSLSRKKWGDLAEPEIIRAEN